MSSRRPHKAFDAFTLAELLIALAILGVIATFTIPKVLQAQQDERYNAIAKEAAASIASSFSLYRLNNLVTASTKPADLTPYFNYVSLDTASLMDSDYGNGSNTCSNSEPCLHLYNGSVLYFRRHTLGGTTTTNAIGFYFDPDGVYSGTTNGMGKSVQFFLYSNGFITSASNSVAGTVYNGVTLPHPGTGDPPWFHWN